MKHSPSYIKKLHQKKYRKEYDEFLVEGIKGVEEALKANTDIVLIGVDKTREKEEGIRDILREAEKRNISVDEYHPHDVAMVKSTDTFPGVLAVVKIPFVKEEVLELTEPIICLDDVTDPGNLGTIIRTADWFGVKHILLSSDCVDAYNEKVVRSTMGSLFHVNIFESKDIVQTVTALRKKGYQCVGLDLNGKPLDTLKPTEKSIYLFGSESHGIRSHLDKLIDLRYTIVGTGHAESLNVAVSAGIVLSRI